MVFGFEPPPIRAKKEGEVKNNLSSSKSNLFTSSALISDTVVSSASISPVVKGSLIDSEAA
jgi:hypothetical protein